MRIISVFFLSLCSWLVVAQKQTYKLTPLNLQDLSAFVKPASNWKVAGAASGIFTSNTLKTSVGNGVLFNDFTEAVRYKPEANLFTIVEHGDLILSFDFMMPKGSNSGIYFQGRYEIQLFDSWSKTVLLASDCGGIYERWNETLPVGKKGYEGHPPRTNATLAPGLWQHLDIEFQAPKFNATGTKIQSARFVSVTLNGVVIHENVVLNGPTRAAAFTDEKAFGPLMLQGDHGQVAFQNIEYALLNEFTATISDVKYEYYEGHFETFEQATPDKLVRKGSADAIDSRLADDPNKMCLLFHGTITVPENTTYQFTLRKHGTAKLEIDGKEVLKTNTQFGDVGASVDLSAGAHKFKLGYIKNFSWATTGVGLFISKVNARSVALHVPTSIPKEIPVPLISVNASSAPELIRSFAQFNGKKKTHVISVGDVQGTHYMYDLSQAALLYVWHGDFLNVTNMWHERGEPQTASAMGATVMQAGRCPLVLLKNKTDALPDTLNDAHDLHYKSMKLDDKGYPTFSYQYKDVLFNDALKPNQNRNGIIRTLSIENIPATENLIVRLSEGKVIEAVDENIYRIDNQYYIQVAPHGKVKPIIHKSATKMELVLEHNATTGSAISYTLIW
jgi:hypothetical protein